MLTQYGYKCLFEGHTKPTIQWFISEIDRDNKVKKIYRNRNKEKYHYLTKMQK